jgi:hypothetical protein
MNDEFTAAMTDLCTVDGGAAALSGEAVTLLVADPRFGGTAPATPAPTAKPLLTWAQLQARALKIGYAELFRHNEKYVGRTVYFKGEIIQVVDGGDGTYDLRVNVTHGEYGFYSDTVYLHYSGERLLDDDIIDFVGIVDGVITYTSVLGGEITIPELTIVRARILAHG